jgi:hypothetical protein
MAAATARQHQLTNPGIEFRIADGWGNLVGLLIFWLLRATLAVSSLGQAIYQNCLYG